VGDSLAARLDAAGHRSSRDCGNGEVSSAVPADPDASRLASLSATWISDPSIEHTSGPPAAIAR